jgi:hypothetical protein
VAYLTITGAEMCGMSLSGPIVLSCTVARMWSAGAIACLNYRKRLVVPASIAFDEVPGLGCSHILALPLPALRRRMRCVLGPGQQIVTGPVMDHQILQASVNDVGQPSFPRPRQLLWFSKVRPLL